MTGLRSGIGSYVFGKDADRFQHRRLALGIPVGSRPDCTNPRYEDPETVRHGWGLEAKVTPD